jgi:hypothetical protein
MPLESEQIPPELVGRFKNALLMPCEEILLAPNPSHLDCLALAMAMEQIALHLRARAKEIWQEHQT